MPQEHDRCASKCWEDTGADRENGSRGHAPVREIHGRNRIKRLSPLCSKRFVLNHALSGIQVNSFKSNSLPIRSIGLVATGQLRYVGA